MKKRPIPELPRPRDVVADIADLEVRLVDLASQIRALEAERAGLAHQQEATSPAVTEADVRVAALLGEKLEIAPPVKTRLAEIAQQLFDLRAASDLADGRRRVALAKASVIIRAAIAPEYRRRVRAVVEGLKAAHAGSVALHELTDQLEDEQVTWTGLGVAFPSLLGHPSDPSGPLAHYLRDLVDQGHIAPRDIPAELQQK